MTWSGIENRQNVSNTHDKIFDKISEMGERQAGIATNIVNIKEHLATLNGRVGDVEDQSFQNDKAITMVRTVGSVLFGLAGLGAAVWQAIGG
jgi:membrane peptidoglycan carboxypeptidase